VHVLVVRLGLHAHGRAGALAAAGDATRRDDRDKDKTIELIFYRA
jgi:hypothetical protein